MYLKGCFNETNEKELSTETMWTSQNATSNKLKLLNYKLNQLNNFWH